MTTAAACTTRLYRPEDEDAAFEVIHAVHGDANPDLDRAYWHWRYLDFPDFAANIVLAELDGRVIGLTASAYFDFRRGDHAARGGMITGVAVHPDARGKGVFRAMIDHTNAHAAEHGAHFTFGMPNEAALPGYMKWGDWKYVGLIPAFAKLICPAAFLRPRIGRLPAVLLDWPISLLFRPRRDEAGMADLTIQPSSRVPRDIDRCADEFARDVDRLMIHRTAAYWNWRYAERPGHRYRTLLLNKDGNALGAVVTTVAHRGGIDVGLLVDLVARGGRPVVRRLIRAAEADLRDQGVGLMMSQASSPVLQDALKAEGHRRVRDARLPKRFHFIYRPSGVAGLPRAPDAIDDWHLTFGDSDNV